VDEPPRQTARGRAATRPAAGRPIETRSGSSQECPNRSRRYKCRRAASDTERRERPSATAGGSLGDALRNLQRYTQGESFDTRVAAAANSSEIQFDTKGVEFGPWIAASSRSQTQLVHSVRRDVDEGARRHPIQRPQGRLDHRPAGGRASRWMPSTTPPSARCPAQPDAALPPEYPDSKAFFTVTLLQRDARAVTACSDSGLICCSPSSSTLSSACDEAAGRGGPGADRHREKRAGAGDRRTQAGEIVNCDSTAVYRGFDIGTDKIAIADRRGIPHHLIDIADPTGDYTPPSTRAMRLPRSARSTRAGVCRSGWRDRLLLPGVDARIVPGPGRDPCCAAGWRHRRAARRRLLHRLLRKVDAESAVRIQPRDLKRLVRALEVFFLTGRPLTAHFAETQSPIPDVDVLAIGLRPAERIAERVTRRVDEHLRAASRRDPDAARKWNPGDRASVRRLVYRQAMEHLHGVRDELASAPHRAGERRLRAGS